MSSKLPLTTVWLLVTLLLPCLLTICFCFAGDVLGVSIFYKGSVSMLTGSSGDDLFPSSISSATFGDEILLGLGTLLGVTTSNSKPLMNRKDVQSLPNIFNSSNTNNLIKPWCKREVSFPPF